MDYKIPQIKHEILYEAFIPPIEDSTNLKSTNKLQSFYGQLEDESIELTGNRPKNQITKLKGWFSPQWRPKGTIRVWDDILQTYIPLVQATVHARYFVHIESDLTDDNGYFETNKFRCGVNYAIKWERADFDIRNGMFGQVWYNGPNLKHDWNLDIGSGESLMYGTIHRAAYKHFYGDNLGMYRPQLMNGGRTKICYRDGEGTGVFWGDWSASGILPDIQIWGRNNGGVYKSTQQVFGATAHEIGHQAHSQHMGNIQYWQVSKIIYESWADAVEWALTTDEYRILGSRYNNTAAINYKHICTNQESWPNVREKEYSPVFIDLVDNSNQRTIRGSSFPNDMVTGYTMEYINRYILPNSYGISSLYNAVKNNKVTGVNDVQIDELFALYW
jgi:hypothetical protein